MWPPLRQRTACSGRTPQKAARHFYFGGQTEFAARHALSGGHMLCADRRRNAFRAECSRRGKRSRSTRSGPAAVSCAECDLAAWWADGGASPQPRPREPRPRRRSRSLRSERESGRPARAATRQLRTPVAAVSNLHKAVDLVHNI